MPGETNKFQKSYAVLSTNGYLVNRYLVDLYIMKLYNLQLNDSPYSNLDIFFVGITLVTLILLVFKFLAKGNRDNLEEIGESQDDEADQSGDSFPKP